jgi:hypothetical protein
MWEEVTIFGDDDFRPFSSKNNATFGFQNWLVGWFMCARPENWFSKFQLTFPPSEFFPLSQCQIEWLSSAI